MIYLKKIFLLSVFVTSSISIFSQFELTGQYKARAEFSNGSKQPLLINQNPGFYISQRARIGGIYKHERFQFDFSIQDVRTWGSTSHLAIDNNGLLSVYEANVSLLINKRWRLKVGRQPISYDNQRIFGALDWAMQGRRHDGVVLKFKDSLWSIDIGATYNQEKESNTEIFYTINNYKTFQYLWANKKWDRFTASFLFLNNGFEQIYLEDSTYQSRTNFSQTMGTHLEYKRKKYEVIAYGYYQMGFTKNNQTLNAYNLSLEVTYKPNKKLGITLGGEILSGTTEEGKINDRNKSFTPLYGTNHKFNGYMDYFYVGNHGNNIGLIDGYFKGKYTRGKYTFMLANHIFYTASDIQTPTIPFGEGFVAMDPFLGYEADFTLKYQYAEKATIQAGYSHLFGTRTMRELKEVDNDNTSGWAYLMLTVKPF